MYMKNSYVTRSMGNNLPRIRRELKGIEFAKQDTEPIIDEMNQRDIKRQKQLSLKQMIDQEPDNKLLRGIIPGHNDGLAGAGRYLE